MCHSFTIASYQELERTLREFAKECGFSDTFTIARSILKDEEDLAKDGGSHSFDLTDGGAVERVAAVAYPGTFAPVILAAPEASGQNHLFELRADLMGFGWPVEWKKGTVFNARLESLLKRGGMWGEAIDARRCAVPCDSFFESHRTETVSSRRTGKPIKRRYVFSSPDSSPLLLAAVYDGSFFSIVTTDADPQVSSVHDRMPFVLSREQARIWLDPESDAETIAEVCAKAAESEPPLVIAPLDQTEESDSVTQTQLF